MSGGEEWIHAVALVALNKGARRRHLYASLRVAYFITKPLRYCSTDGDNRCGVV